jgi:hypothetical protein
MTSSSAKWTVQRTTSSRFPYRISIERGNAVILAVRAKSSWPGPGQQIFCLRENGLDPEEYLETIDSASVSSMEQLGRKLTVVLDRSTKKRCEFLRVEKRSKETGETYEQIFFRTESGIHAHRSRSRLELRGSEAPLTVVIDSAERYAWTFSGATVLRRRLAAGDYALMHEGKTLAVIERKSFDGFIADLGAIQAFHHQLGHLNRSENAVLVVEAQYADFLDPKRLEGRWPPSFLSKAIAEICAMHPSLRVVFAGNRKLANHFATEFFRACLSSAATTQLSLVMESPALYEATRAEDAVRAAVLEKSGGFSLSDIASGFADVKRGEIRRILSSLEAEGLVTREGRGRGTKWSRA